MKLYLGSRNYKPEGYLTVDIDPVHEPDIISDITNMTTVADCSCDEIVAGHVLEHIDWPDTFAAMAEFQRVLRPGGLVKVAVPDMSSLLRMLLSGESAFHVMGLIYGIGGRTNPLERHRYGFTVGMIVDIFDVLGFSDFDWWNSSLSDASNGWAPRGMDERIGISLNIQATKSGSPLADPRLLYEALKSRPLDDFLTIATQVRGAAIDDRTRSKDPAKLLQLMHYKLIESQQRIRYLEQQADRK